MRVINKLMMPAARMTMPMFLRKHIISFIFLLEVFQLTRLRGDQ